MREDSEDETGRDTLEAKVRKQKWRNMKRK